MKKVNILDFSMQVCMRVTRQYAEQLIAGDTNGRYRPTTKSKLKSILNKAEKKRKGELAAKADKNSKVVQNQFGKQFMRTSQEGLRPDYPTVQHRAYF